MFEASSLWKLLFTQLCARVITVWLWHLLFAKINKQPVSMLILHSRIHVADPTICNPRSLIQKQNYPKQFSKLDSALLRRRTWYQVLLTWSWIAHVCFFVNSITRSFDQRSEKRSSFQQISHKRTGDAQSHQEQAHWQEVRGGRLRLKSSTSSGAKRTC